MNWNITLSLISGALIQLLGETHAICNHPSRGSTCKTTDFGIDVRHDICFLKKTYTNGGITYERGGTNENVCMKNAALSSLRNPDCKSPHPPVNTVCYDCCTAHCPESRFCNQQNGINPNYMPSYMQTGPGPTTSTSLPTTSSSSTTTSTSLPTTSSSSTTTTTAMVNGTKCLVCTEDQSNSCSSVDYTVCSGERPYCLNEIIYHNGKWIKTLHRCASEVECYWDYWIGTGNGTDCIQNGVCAYCCQISNGKPCNAVTEKPTSLSNFGLPQNRAYKCVVTGPQNSNTIQNCPPSERFCLNDVYYDTDPTTLNLITRDVRRCASQEQCKGKWLQSKKINACLTGNMTGVDASKTGNMLLCHYCCESNTMTPCNLHPKPDQINLFIQPTSLPIVSSTVAPTNILTPNPGVNQQATPTASPRPCENRRFWSEWINNHKPNNVGESEFMHPKEITNFCATGKISKIECTTLDGTDFSASGEMVTCTLNEGFNCDASLNDPFPCSDYRVRYECKEVCLAVCQDKPGVDCLLLNATNICANPNAQKYCAAFCGHC